MQGKNVALNVTCLYHFDYIVNFPKIYIRKGIFFDYLCFINSTTLPHLACTWLYVLITISQSPHHKQDDLGSQSFCSGEFSIGGFFFFKIIIKKSLKKRFPSHQISKKFEILF